MDGSKSAASKSMRALVSGLLDLARSDQAKTAAARERFDWSRCALDACLPFEPVFFERGLTFSYDVEPGLFVLGDEAQLKRCANILLDNAQKYAAPGGACSLRLMRHGKNRCRLCISSEGAPLSAEACRKIFERFYRADSSRSTQGFGIGLSLVRVVAEAHKGKLSITLPEKDRIRISAILK